MGKKDIKETGLRAPKRASKFKNKKMKSRLLAGISTINLQQRTESFNSSPPAAVLRSGAAH